LILGGSVHENILYQLQRCCNVEFSRVDNSRNGMTEPNILKKDFFTLFPVTTYHSVFKVGIYFKLNMYDIYLSVGTDISEPVVTGRCWFVFNFYFCIFLQFLFHFWYFYFLMYIVCSVYCFLVLVLPLWRINFIILVYFYQSAGVKDVSTDLNIEMVRESLTETGQWP